MKTMNILSAFVAVSLATILILAICPSTEAAAPATNHAFRCENPSGCIAFGPLPNNLSKWGPYLFREDDILYSSEQYWLPRKSGWVCRSCPVPHAPNRGY